MSTASHQKITVLGTVERSGKAKASGNDYHMVILQCAITTQQQGQPPQVKVGELMLPKEVDTPANGDYVAELELFVDRENKIHGVVKALKPLRVEPTARASA